MPPRFTLIIAALALLALVGCDRPAPAAAKVEADAAPADMRIVSLAPSVTETLFGLGVGDEVVGVTRFCDFPIEVKSLAKIGGLTDVDVEMVLSLRPTLVVGVKSETGSALERTLAAADVKTLFVPVETFADVQQAMRDIGTAVGAAPRGEELAAAIGALNETPADGAPQVLVLFGRDPWVAAGPGTFADEMIRRAGGKNVLSDLDTPYPSLDLERLSSLKPSVVIDTSWGGPAEQPALPIGGVDLVRLDPALIRPGPRIVDAMKQFRAAVVRAEIR